MKLLGVFIIVGAMAVFWYFVSWPERAAQAQDFVPKGLRVVLVDFAGEPNIVAFPKSSIAAQELQTYANTYCGYEVQVAALPASWFDKLFGRERAQFIC
jgi:hypothetical protein